jgi:dimethylargininase
MFTAITRAVSPAMANCELTFLDRVEIDIALANRQHHAYEQALAGLGCQVIALPAEPELPDSVFVEDAAIVLDEVAVITRPGAESRRAETETIGQALRPFRELVVVESPGTVDGGDVLVLGKTIYVGASSRSNRQAVEQMQSTLGRFGYRVEHVPVRGCLHLKSAVTLAAEGVLLSNPQWVDVALFPGMAFVEVDPSEPHGANVLRIGDAVIYSSSHPRTRERMEKRGIRVVAVDVSEMEKAEGAVTCCSLVF